MTRSQPRLARLESLRKAEERSARASLAMAVEALGQAEAAVPAQPSPLAEAGFDGASFRSELSRLRLDWASLGMGLGRVDAARAAAEDARQAWSSSAVSLRSVQRLVHRKQSRRRAERAQRERRDLDEISLTSWGRRHG